MNKQMLEMRQVYHQVNSVTGSVNAVLFGSTAMAEIPAAELVHCFGLNLSVCNRSMEGLTVSDALTLAEECVISLRPRTIFLSFGDGEVTDEAFFASYRRLIRAIASGCCGKLFLVPPMGMTDRRFLAALQALAAETACQYIDTCPCQQSDRPILSLFSHLTRHMRPQKLNLGNAMDMS